MKVLERSAAVSRAAAGPLAAMTRCAPEANCRQSSDCARCDVPPNRDALTIDGTVCRVGGWCPLFIDKRGVALLSDPRLKHLECF